MPANSRVSNFLSALLGAGVVALVVAGLAIGGAFDSDEGAGTVVTSESSNQPAAAAGAVQNLNDVSDLYDKVREGVVYVQVSAARGPSVLGRGGERQGSGSGFVLDEEGHLLTNEHVVEDTNEVRVRIGDAAKLIPARVMGTDPSSDLAVLKVDPDDVEGELVPIALGSSDGLEVGQPTVAMGSPFGLEGSLTTGVISALDRPIEAPNGFTIDGALQTDAAINPGNSGGPLLDAAGRVIGINAQIATSGVSASNSGVGFAIPVETAKQVVPALKKGEEIDRAYLGVSTATAPQGGALVAQVVPNAPADDAGIEERDRIVEIDGKEVRESGDVSAVVTSKRPGARVPIVVVRDGERETLNVELGTRPDQVRD